MIGLLTFELGKDNDELFIHGDPAGLRRLSQLLATLATSAEQGKFPHEHLFTAEWGSDELSSEAQEEGHRCVPHVKVFGWPDSRGSKPYQTANGKPI